MWSDITNEVCVKFCVCSRSPSGCGIYLNLANSITSADDVTIECCLRHIDQTIVTQTRQEVYVRCAISILFAALFTGAFRVRDICIYDMTCGPYEKWAYQMGSYVAILQYNPLLFPDLTIKFFWPERTMIKRYKKGYILQYHSKWTHVQHTTCNSFCIIQHHWIYL